MIGRPHIADALVAHGAIPDRSEAFREIQPFGPVLRAVLRALPGDRQPGMGDERDAAGSMDRLHRVHREGARTT